MNSAEPAGVIVPLKACEPAATVDNKSHGPLAGPEHAFRFEGPVLRASSQTWTVAVLGDATVISLGAGPKHRASL
jgi:hypothetical protein